MLGGMITMVGFFTAYYLFRQLGCWPSRKEGFGGSQALYDYVFIPVLTIHIILVIIGLVMAVHDCVGVSISTIHRRKPCTEPVVATNLLEESRTDLSEFC